MTEALPPLAADEFDAYFSALWGHAPFPWQSRLAHQVARSGEWPSVLDLPTGTGKTAVLEIALFHLALEADAVTRRAPLRIVYVVDRRTIVDQAHDRSRKIVSALGGATAGVLDRVRLRLSSLTRGDAPVHCALLRGGMARSNDWARRPDQPLLAISTVDQVGSRLLFRGYGVSDSMKPVHAGLLGNDALYLLDEVHLSQPFCETLQAVSERYRSWAEVPLASPFHVVQMSATVVGDAGGQGAFQLSSEDREDAVLARRLRATKAVTLRGPIAPRAFAAEVERAVRDIVADGAPRAVGVIVNRVQSAREVHERLLRSMADRFDVALVTGRMRPLDRAHIEAEIIPRIASGRDRGEASRPLIIVATQCIEAGADFDFDALVTECAGLDALRQRFGRLNRLGMLASAPGVIIARADALKDDAVYGTAYAATWEWLSAMEAVDFGIDALELPEATVLESLLAPREHSPVMLPAHLDAWVQTSPRPQPDPDVSLWLHGPKRGDIDVQLVWRADVDAEDLAAALDGGDGEAERRVLSAIEAVPPSSAEAMAVPLSAVRRWLEGRVECEVVDVEGRRDDEADHSERATRPARAAIAWRGDRSRVVAPSDIRPGDTVVVPVSHGGVEFGTWSPGSVEPVRDVGDAAALQQRGRAVLRLHPLVIGAPVPIPSSGDDEDVPDDRTLVTAWLAAPPSELSARTKRAIECLRSATGRRRFTVDRIVGSKGFAWFVVHGRDRCVAKSDDEPAEAAATTEDDSSSFTGVAVSLGSHMTGVGSLAAEFARRAGLSASLVADVERAGRWHDAGKADPRFQRMLHGGSEFRALTAPELLAKSAVPMESRERREAARLRAGYPNGQRHELASVALISTSAELMQQASNAHLVLHLVASHHGRCRPFAPWVADEAAPAIAYVQDGIALKTAGDHALARLDSGVADRFWALVRRHGWWGLAWLEAMLRLADHRRSEAEQGAETGT